MSNFGTDSYGDQSGSAFQQGNSAGSGGYSGIAQLFLKLAGQNISGSVDATQEQNSHQTGGHDINAQYSSPYGVNDMLATQVLPSQGKNIMVNQKPLGVAPSQNFQPAPVHNSYNYSPWASAYLNGGY